MNFLGSKELCIYLCSLKFASLLATLTKMLNFVQEFSLAFGDISSPGLDTSVRSCYQTH